MAGLAVVAWGVVAVRSLVAALAVVGGAIVALQPRDGCLCRNGARACSASTSAQRAAAEYLGLKVGNVRCLFETC